MTKVAIIGAGQGGKLVLNIFRQFYPDYEIAGFIDDKKAGETVEGIKVIGAAKDLSRIKRQADSFIVGIGCTNLKARTELFEKAKKAGLKPVNAINPNCFIDKTAKLGNGITIFPNVTINMNVVIGDNVTIYSGAVVEHECAIGNNVYIGPGAHISGRVKIGNETFIGVGANLVQDLKIGKNSVIGAGAAVLKDIPDNVVAAGVPAKVLHENKNEKGCKAK